jgi:uncharacterized integral membrane protein
VRVPRWLPAAAVTLLAAAIAWFNRGETVALNLGFATFYRAPLTVILFLAFLAGMMSMLWLGLRQDLRMREELRARGILDVPSRPAAPAAPEWSRPEETVVRSDTPASGEAHPPVASTWAQSDETVVRADAPSASPPAASAWAQSDEAVVRADPPPAEDRTVIYPRYDEDPAA